MSTGRRAARYEKSPEGYPFVVFDWDGREVAHGFDSTKGPLFERGLVYLGPEFVGRVPPQTVTIEGTTTRFYGFVKDPEVTRIVDTFFRALEDGSFRVGPV
jgi:hypothetical protein